MNSIATFRNRAAVAAALVILLTWIGPARAQFFGGDQLKSNPKVVKLFRPAVAKTSESTVRIQCDGKDVALGAVVGPNGWIVTKASDLKGSIVVKLKDGRELSATVVGLKDDFDLAMLKVDAAGLRTVEWRDSKEAKVGRWVASASPDEDPVAIGVVSVATRAFKLGDQPPKMNLLDGGYLGVSLKDAPKDNGAMITTVEKGTPAEKAGLKVNDVVFQINDKKVSNAETMIDAIHKHKPGTEVTVHFKRGDEDLELKAKLEKRPAKLAGNPQEFMGSKLSARRGGFPVILQHDTIIKPADCGGPLVDLDGKVVGINIARAGRSESYAIPSEAVQGLLLPLMSGMLPPPEDPRDAPPRSPSGK
jgi:serine protease Do